MGKKIKILSFLAGSILASTTIFADAKVSMSQERLEALAKLMQAGSICGLGRTAPNPVISTLKFFKNEYEAHLQGRCPAGKCRDLITYTITDRCIGCSQCARACGAGAIAFTPWEQHVIDQEKCEKCNACVEVCPEYAIKVK